MAYSYIFGGNTGETPETLKRKRELAMAIMGAQSAPRNVGEGLTALGAGITAGIMNRRADKAESAGRAEAGALSNDLRSQLAARIAGTPLPPANRSGPGSVISTTPAGGTPSGGPSSYRDAIASIESKGSGDYAAVGPTNPKMGRALGRYQIMESNIAPWSREALGREVSADEFLANPQIQDAIFDHKFGGYVDKFGQEGAAQAWFAGPGGVGKTDRKDVLGTDVGTYGRKFMTALGPQPQEVASLDASIGMPSTAAGAVTAMGQGGQPAPQPAHGLPQQFQGSQQLANASGGIMHALNGETPAGGDQVAQAGAAGGTPQPQPEQDQGPSEELLYQIMTHPFSSPEQKAVAQTLLDQKEWTRRQDYEQRAKQSDPNYQLEQDYRRAQIDKMNREASGDGETFFGNPVAVQNADGSVGYGQIGNRGTFRPIQLGEGQSFAPPTKTIDTGTETILMDQAGNVISRTPKDNRQAERDKALGSGEGKVQAEKQAEYDSITSKMPGLYSVVDRLSQLAEGATYTMAGRALDYGIGQLGMEPRDSAVARAEYTAIVDNQILPLLRDTFGAQFTNEEGLRLSRTLGDADKTPTEKAALLRAFIQQKERDIQALATQLGKSGGGQGEVQQNPQQQPAGIDPEDWKFMTPEERKLFQ